VARLFYKVLGLCLASLGFGCDDKGNNSVEYGPQPEYGVFVATATYHITGKVVKASDQTPIEGIRVEWKYFERISNDEGAFGFSLVHPPLCGFDLLPPCSLIVTDVDGSANGGHYVAKAIELSLTQTDPGDGGLDLGTYRQQNITIELDEEP